MDTKSLGGFGELVWTVSQLAAKDYQPEKSGKPPVESYESLCDQLNRHYEKNKVDPDKILKVAERVWNIRPNKQHPGLEMTQLIFRILRQKKKQKKQKNNGEATNPRDWAIAALEGVRDMRFIPMGEAQVQPDTWDQKVEEVWDLHPVGSEKLKNQRKLHMSPVDWQLVALALRRTFPPLKKSVSMQAATHFHMLQQLSLGGSGHAWAGRLGTDDNIPRALGTILLAARKIAARKSDDVQKHWKRFHDCLVTHVDSGACQLTRKQWEYVRKQLGSEYALSKMTLDQLIKRQKPSPIPPRLRPMYSEKSAKYHPSLVTTRLSNRPIPSPSNRTLVSHSHLSNGRARMKESSPSTRVKEMSMSFLCSRTRPRTISVGEIISRFGEAQKNNSVDRCMIDTLCQVGIMKKRNSSQTLDPVEKRAVALAFLHLMVCGDELTNREKLFDTCVKVAGAKPSELNSQSKQVLYLKSLIVKTPEHLADLLRAESLPKNRKTLVTFFYYLEGLFKEPLKNSEGQVSPSLNTPKTAPIRP